MLGLGTRIEIGGQTENVLAPGPAIRIYECRRSALRDKPTLELCSDMSAFSHLAALGGSVSADCWLAAYSQRFDANSVRMMCRMKPPTPSFCDVDPSLLSN